MALAEDFNTESYRPPAGYEVSVRGEHVIQAGMKEDGSTIANYTFDFLNRVVTVSPFGSSAATQVFLFSQFDEGSVEWHYNQLVKAGKNPRPPESVTRRRQEAPPPVHKLKT